MYFLVSSMLSKEKIKHIRKLHDKKWRNESGFFLVEGRKMILELLSSSWRDHIQELYVSEELYQEIQEGDISYLEDISKISTLENNRDGVAIVEQRKLSSSQLHIWWTLVLDGIRDPGNMGTILRTASWFGVTQVVCSPDCVDMYNSKVVSATMWALFHIEVYSLNLEEFYTWNTLTVFGAELDGTNISHVNFPSQWVLVMGSESHGLSDISKKYVTQNILIERKGSWESLNVAIATGIILSKII